MEYNSKIQRFRNAENSLNLISKTDENILVGMEDLNDEKLKNDILSIAGEDAQLIEFAEFIPQFDFFAKEPPEKVGARYNVGSVGEFATIAGEYMTVGSPINSNHDSFYTANHGILTVGSNVNIANIYAGSVTGVTFKSNADITTVSLASGTISNRGITTYRGTTSNNASVKAYTAYSGTISGTVISSVATVSGPAGTMNGMILVNMKSQGGDSGAALVQGSTAVGILSFGATLNGSAVTVFTCTNNI